MFYFHQFDNARILEFLFRAWRIKFGLTQEKLAVKYETNRAFISALENYFSVSESGQRSRVINRNEVIEYLSRLDIKDRIKRIDLLLWLFDGQFLTDEELKIFFGQELEINLDHRNDPRSGVIDLLTRAQKIFTTHAEQQRRPASDVTIIPYQDEEDLVGEYLWKMEEKRSVWLIMKQIPSYITRCLDVVDNKIVMCSANNKIASIRATNFLWAIEKYGVKIIHEENTIKDYVSKTNPQFQQCGEARIRQVKVMVKLMEEYGEHFQVRLSPYTTPFEFQMNGLETVMMRARLRIDEYSTQKTGISSFIRYIKLMGERNILPFILEFETIWNNLSSEYSNETKVNDKAIEKLTGFLNN